MGKYITYYVCNNVTDEPSAPRALSLPHVSRDGVTLSWSAPMSDGGSPIEGYIVEKCAPGSSRWTKVNRQPIKSTEMNYNDVSVGEEWQFRVTAVNAAGQGKPSEATLAVKIKDPFGKNIKKLIFLFLVHFFKSTVTKSA